MTPAPTTPKAILPLRILRARPRLFVCVAVGVALGALLPGDWRPVTRMLVAWDGAVLLYVALVGAMMADSNTQNIIRRARVQDEGQFTILALAMVAAVASLGAIVLQLGAVKDMAGMEKALHIGLAALTIVSSFAFIHLMFALHYAHEFYAEERQGVKRPENQRGGLMFPGDQHPTYPDFLYFSYVIGVASQTADVSTCSRAMRMIALIHGVVSFFFNTTVLALTINIAAGLI